MNSRIIFVSVLGFSTIVASSQGTFQNLNFEQASILSVGTGVSAASAFPEWQVSIAGSQISVVEYDALSVGAPSVAIFDNKTGFMPIQGNYTAYLQSAGNGVVGDSITLSQTGVVPIGTESIWLDANQEQNGSFEVTVGGDNINMVPLQSFPGYTLYGGNLSDWSGKDANLSITEFPPSNPIFSPNLLQLDDIMFSPVMVTPEPGPVILMGIGGALFAAYRRFAAKGR